MTIPEIKVPFLPKGWHSRGFLPHYDGGQVPQSITFRLAGSLPLFKLKEWEDSLNLLSKQNKQIELYDRIEKYLDKSIGIVWLSQPEIAEIVENALLFFDDKRYKLHAWVIMPNHVHVLVTPAEQNGLSEIVHSWKSFTANKANALLRRNGAFWQEDYFDRYIRNANHFEAEVLFIEYNPVKAGLCATPKGWRFSSANHR